jgi:hypothetical protein
MRHNRLWRLKLLAGCGILLLPSSLLALDPAKSVFQFNCQSWIPHAPHVRSWKWNSCF